MNCDQVQVMLGPLMDNELTDAEAEGVYRHLGTCIQCRGIVRSHLEVRAALLEDPQPQAPPELDARIMNAVGTPVPRSIAGSIMRASLWRRHIAIPLPVAAIIAGLFFFGSLALSSVWSPFAKPQVRIVYITTLPTVEVQGYMP
ncbi:MAG TPA: zf-HC2 domain-containing protein [Bacteroidota bacterium]|nr:zf-HC2 domain-containing protein [Bacteroidota bacterium]